jgi:hypothetical protein
MEARQNNQFELLNENFRMFSSTMENKNRKLYKLINVLNENSVSLSNFNKYNSNLAIHKVSIKVEPKSSVDEVIILDDDPQPLNVESKFSVPGQKGKSSNLVPSSQHNQSQPAYSNLTAPIKTERYAVDYERLVTVTSKTNDTTKKAVATFMEFWREEIEAGVFKYGDFNVYGFSPKGSIGAKKQALVPKRVNLLQKFIVDKMEHGFDQDRIWAKCVSAIHKKLYTLRGANTNQAKIGSCGSSDDSGR